MNRAALSLGANMGNRIGNLRTAVRLMKLNELQVLERSDIFETAPFGVYDQPRFLNACILVETDLAPFALLELLKRIEKETGRVMRRRWGPREIDIDILLMEDMVIRTAQLEIPHPGIEERPFVLRPLAQIAPCWIHPISGKTALEMWEEISRVDNTMIRIGSL